MDDKVHYIFERAITMAEQQSKRLLIALIICIILLFASNALWLYEWCQYDYVDELDTTTYMQDGEGVNIIGNENEVK